MGAYIYLMGLKLSTSSNEYKSLIEQANGRVQGFQSTKYTETNNDGIVDMEIDPTETIPISNRFDQVDVELATGGSYIKAKPNKSIEFSFSTVLTYDEVKAGLLSTLEFLAQYAHDNDVKLVIRDDGKEITNSKELYSLNVRVTSLEPTIETQDYIVLKWTVKEQAKFVSKTVKYSTFIEKKNSNTPTVKSKENIPPTIKKLILCKIVFADGKISKSCKKKYNSCDDTLQKFLRRRGYYPTPYAMDGKACHYTYNGFIKWQKVVIRGSKTKKYAKLAGLTKPQTTWNNRIRLFLALYYDKRNSKNISTLLKKYTAYLKKKGLK